MCDGACDGACDGVCHGVCACARAHACVRAGGGLLLVVGLLLVMLLVVGLLPVMLLVAVCGGGVGMIVCARWQCGGWVGTRLHCAS